MTIRPFAVALALLLLCTAAPHSQGQAPSTQTAQPVFRASTDYVELDVVVTKSDITVKDLTKDDFEITERGRVQRIADFRFEYVPPTRRPMNVATAVPTIDVATNTHPPTGRQWVLVIDDLHIFEQRLVETQRVVQSFLERVSPNDQVAIVFTGHSNLSQDFTSDLGAQMRVVGRIKESLGFAENPPSAMNPDTSAASCGQRFTNARSSIYVLSNVASALSRSTFPRRTLVFASHGLGHDPSEPMIDMKNLATAPGPGRLQPNTLQTTTPNPSPNATKSNAEICPYEDTNALEISDEVKLIVKKARESGVSVYTVDPRGVVTDTDVARDGQTADARNLKIELDFMRNVADSTGGRPMVNRNMEQAIPDLIEDNSSFYLLGYYPDPFVRDGQFHDVKVTVKRSGMRVRSRVGYTAPRTTKASVVETKQTLEDALGAALPVSGLTLSAFAAPIAPAEHGMTTTVTLDVTYPAPVDRGKIDDELQFGIVALDRDGKIRGSTRRAFHFTGSPSSSEFTYAINDTLDLPAEPLTLRIGASSQSLGRAGTVHLPIEVNAPSKNDVQIPSVVLGFDGPPRQAAVPPGALKDLVPFQPVATRTFAQTDTLRLFAPVFWSAQNSSLDLTIAVRGATTITPRREIVDGHAASAGRQHQGALDTTLSLADLVPGQYVLEITARLDDAHSARRDVAFEIK